MTDADPLKIAMVGGVATAVVVAIAALVYDPTSAFAGRLDAVDLMVSSGHKLAAVTPAKLDIGRLAQTPLFVMTTGAAAYKERSFQLYGVSISAQRKAALVSIDGAPASWMAVGASNGDVRLTDVGTNGVSFETPVGQKVVSLTDTPSTAGSAGQSSSASNPAQGG